MIKGAKPISMKDTRTELAARIRPMTEQLTDQLVDLLVGKLEDSLGHLSESIGAALASVTGSINEEERPKVLRGGKRKQLINGEAPRRRNHCANCGAEGFQTKTCGVTHDKNGPIPRSNGRSASPRKSQAATTEDDDDEEAEVDGPRDRVPVPAVASPSRPAPDPPRSRAPTPAPPAPPVKPKPVVQVDPRPAGLPKPTASFAVGSMYDETQEESPAPMFRAAPKPRSKSTPKTKREKALNEIRIENMKKLMRAKQRNVPREPIDVESEDDEDLPVMTEAEAAKIDVAQID